MGLPKWLEQARAMLGKKETDPDFNKKMSGKWGLVGLSLKTIDKNWAAWCGLFIAVSLSGAGYQWQKNGAGAKNWDKYGQAIDWHTRGIPRGALVRINHKANCGTTSNNHITMSNGDCSPQDLKKAGATFTGLGGNQSNQVKLSSFPVAHICAVRWPNEEALPAPVTVSSGCNGSSGGKESTR